MRDALNRRADANCKRLPRRFLSTATEDFFPFSVQAIRELLDEGLCSVQDESAGELTDLFIQRIAGHHLSDSAFAKRLSLLEPGPCKVAWRLLVVGLAGAVQKEPLQIKKSPCE